MHSDIFLHFRLLNSLTTLNLSVSPSASLRLNNQPFRRQNVCHWRLLYSFMTKCEAEAGQTRGKWETRRCNNKGMCFSPSPPFLCATSSPARKLTVKSTHFPIPKSRFISFVSRLAREDCFVHQFLTSRERVHAARVNRCAHVHQGLVFEVVNTKVCGCEAVSMFPGRCLTFEV